MTQPNDGGPAFPSDRFGEPGLTLRDWFAGQVLQGLVSDGKRYEDSSVEDVAVHCYEMADAMLKARSANV